MSADLQAAQDSIAAAFVCFPLLAGISRAAWLAISPRQVQMRYYYRGREGIQPTQTKGKT